MKKRLSENNWQRPTMVIAIMGLIGVLSFLLRSVSLPARYGFIGVELPVLSIPIVDPSFHRFQEEPDAMIEPWTPMVVLTKKALFFADVESFSKDILQIRKKFKIPHIEQAPNLKELARDLEKWTLTQIQQSGHEHQGIVVFLPTDQIPVAHIIQSVSVLKAMPVFSRVVLAGGVGP